MGKGIIRITPKTLQNAIDNNDINGVALLRKDNKDIDLPKSEPSVIKEALLLPDNYTVHEVRQDTFAKLNGFVEIVVSSDEIPEVNDGEALPSVNPIYYKDYSLAPHGVAVLKEIKIER